MQGAALRHFAAKDADCCMGPVHPIRPLMPQSGFAEASLSSCSRPRLWTGIAGGPRALRGLAGKA